MATPRSQIELPLDIWLQEVHEELSKVTQCDAKQVSDGKVKLELEYEVPLIPEAVQHTQPISGPYHVSHLHLSIDITSIVRFEEQGEQAVCIVPHKTFAVNTKPGAPKEQQIDLTAEQSDDIAGTYRAHILSVLQLIKRFPDVTHLDIDIIGSIPNRSTDVLYALGANSIALYAYVSANLPDNLKKITLLCGHTLDIHGFVPIGQPIRFKKRKYEWDLQKTYKIVRGQDVDEMNLEDVRAVLRSDKAVSIHPNYKEPKGAMLPKQAGEDVVMAEAGTPEVMITAPSPAMGESALSPPIERMEVESPAADDDIDEDASSRDNARPTSETWRNDFAKHVYESSIAHKGKETASEAMEPDLSYRQDSAAVHSPSATPALESEEVDNLFHG